MALFRRIATNIHQKCPHVWSVSNISTSAPVLAGDKVIKHDVALLRPEEYEHRQQMRGVITVDTADTKLAPISGIPEEQFRERRVRIYRPCKNAMQSGTDNIGNWQMDFDTKQRWENPLMGWSSTGDPLSNLKMRFASKEDAVDFCERNGWSWYVATDKVEKTRGPKSYGINFSWNRRTRTSTK